MTAAPGRLRLRRVAFARLARIREGRALRLVGDESAPTEPRPRRLSPWAERVLLTSSLSRPDLSELEVLVGLVRWSGGDPKVILREWLKKQTKRLREAGPRLVALLEAEYQRHLEGRKAGTSRNAAHRMALRRTLATLRSAGHVPRRATVRDLLSVYDREKKSSLWDAMRKDDEETE